MSITKDLIFGGKKISNENTDTNNIKQIEINKIVDFRDGQPFSFYSKDKMEQMKASISRNGILSPILVRKIDTDVYEIISGHNRIRCAKELNIQTVPTIILDVDDDTAKLIMLESNLNQRDDIPPVEKGMAYKMQLEILKKLKNTDGIHSEYQKSIQDLASNTDNSATTIQRLIRLTELIAPLQEKINNIEQIPLLAGVELSYIGKEEQEIINKVLEENHLKITVAQAEYLREIKGTITEKSIIEMYAAKKQADNKVKFTGKISKSTLNKYKEKFANNDEFDKLVNELLEQYFSQSELV